MTVTAGTTGVTSLATADAEAWVFFGPGRAFERIRVPAVELHPGEALVAVEYATICGSDMHTVAGARRGPVPLVLGHEQVGRVVALSEQRPARDLSGQLLKVGDRIVWGVAVHCGRCRYCHAGLPQKCASLRKYGHDRIRRGWELSGGLATHVQLLAHTSIVKVGDDLAAEVAAPASCATATVAAVLESASVIRPLDQAVVVISGAGMLGITAVAMAVARGATVVATDPDPRRRELAEQFGARATADGTPAALAAALRRIPAARNGAAVGLELSGVSAALSTLISASDIGGVIVCAGSVFSVPPVVIDPETVVRRMLTIRGVHNYAPRHLQQAVEFLQATELPFAELVGEEFPFDETEAAFARAAEPGAPRVGVRP